MQEEILMEEGLAGVETDTATDFAQEPMEEQDAPQSEMSELESLKMQRRGHFDVPSMTMDDLKWLRTYLSQSVEFTGPNEAFVVLQNHNMVLGEIENQKRLDKMPGEKGERKIRLAAACIESCLYFLNKAKFTGLNNAQSLFKVSFQLNGAYSKVHDLDNQIKALEDASKVEDKQSESSK
jgi:CCR4-NOT transcriptional regulation complex NOT5 subunit